jgi:hypothetical protein
VHGVVVAPRLHRLGAQHLAGEHAQLAGQRVLGQALVGTGVDVAHQHPVGGLDDRRQRGGGGAGEHVDLDALPRQTSGQLDDVDVHAARITGARLVERGGVQADHRETAHGPGDIRAHRLPHG